MPTLSSPVVVCHWRQNCHNDNSRFSVLYLIQFLTSSLESLYQRWRTLTPEGVAFVGVNSAVWHSRLLASALKRHVTFPLYQDTAEWSLFEQLGISQGHILVYDRWVWDRAGKRHYNDVRWEPKRFKSPTTSRFVQERIQVNNKGDIQAFMPWWRSFGLIY